jgi:uncharacterized membrane protein YobD (UPF0266 family)
MPTMTFDNDLFLFAKKFLEGDKVQNIGMKEDEVLFVELYEKFHKHVGYKKLGKVI